MIEMHFLKLDGYGRLGIVSIRTHVPSEKVYAQICLVGMTEYFKGDGHFQTPFIVINLCAALPYSVRRDIEHLNKGGTL